MANITITIPDTEIARVLAAVGAKYGYTGKDPQGNNETTAQFAKRQLGVLVRNIVSDYERDAAEAVLSVPPPINPT